ncbi:MAG: DUF1971 domain-containing protein [Bradymonadia bacterium]
MKSLPEDVRPYKRTPSFTAETVPKGLLRQHNTKAGVWGRIYVEEGRLLYRILLPVMEEVELSPGVEGVVEPEVPHEVTPLGEVSFYVEFLRVP